MRIIFTAILILFSYLTSFGQVDTAVVPFVSYWSTGDSYNFKITKIKRQWKEGNLTKNDSSSYVVNFEVIDSTADSYKIKWSYKTDLAKFDIPPKLIEKFSKYSRTEVIYSTSELGEFVGIDNWKELSLNMKSLFADLSEMLAEEENTNKEDIKKVMQPLLRVYESKQGIEQLVFEELQYFHFPFGVEYSATEPILYEEELPNMFGGKPIRGDAKLYFESVDFENSFCVFIREMKLNPEDTKRIVETVFKRMNLNDKELKKAMKTAQFDIRDYNRNEYYYNPGIPRLIDARRESIIVFNEENAKRIDITRIELLD